MNENGTLIFCNNIKCLEIIEYFEPYALPDYCSWTCRAIQREREEKEFKEESKFKSFRMGSK